MVRWSAGIDLGVERRTGQRVVYDHNSKIIRRAGTIAQVTALITLDVHSRDILEKLATQRVPNAQHYLWQSQLRVQWSEAAQDCTLHCCGADFR